VGCGCAAEEESRVTTVTATAGAADARREMYSANALKLGLFCINASSGRSITRVPERWSASWSDNCAVARLADDAGFEFLLPIGRWKGYGGETDAQGAAFETLTWATGMLSITRHITVFATVHAPLVNPVAAAKMMVTADHAGNGRAGLNVVVGWNEDEFEMFGVQQRPAADRYPYGQEWIDVVKRIWSEPEPFDFDGTYLHLKDVLGNPKPVGGNRPILMNAGRSETGSAYAIRNCDALFTDTSKLSEADTAERVRSIREAARGQGRNVEVFSDALVICRPNAQEARDYFEYTHIENVDWGAVEVFLAKKNVRRDNTPPDEFAKRCREYARGMSGKTIVGDPDTVAAELAALSRSGIRGMAMNFVNYLDELPYICAEVLPRLERLGVRGAV
jgi:alkanesulfonate monooxygenase SsuD/methylene tetrahydromethanopterin reductase-like flavin-dependent oxidoreductase (luciferase family)